MDLRSRLSRRSKQETVRDGVCVVRRRGVLFVDVVCVLFVVDVVCVLFDKHNCVVSAAAPGHFHLPS